MFALHIFAPPNICPFRPKAIIFFVLILINKKKGTNIGGGQKKRGQILGGQKKKVGNIGGSNRNRVHHSKVGNIC